MPYIAYIVPEELPCKDLRKILFFTSESPDSNQFFWGNEQVPISEERIKERVKSKKAVEVNPRIPLSSEEIPKVDSEGGVYMVNISGVRDEKLVGKYDPNKNTFTAI